MASVASASADPAAAISGDLPDPVRDAIMRVEAKPVFAPTTWSIHVGTVSGPAQPLTVTETRPGVIRVDGEIAAGGAPILTIYQTPDPSAFARTAFIEALSRAGIKVAAHAATPAAALPDAALYGDANRVAEYVSPPLSEFVKVILKVSYNRGADLMLCLAAVRA